VREREGEIWRKRTREIAGKKGVLLLGWRLGGTRR
jgi:hypothetical protein